MIRSLLILCAALSAAPLTAADPPAPKTEVKGDPAPVGTAPSADFMWYNLPGVGWGWVDSATVKSHKAGTFKATAPPVMPAALSYGVAGSACANGRCPTTGPARR